jgi:shikimate kinase
LDHSYGVLDQRPIALAGFMGVGKTTVGQLVAEALDRPFADTDHHVEAVSGRTVIDFFQNHEEPAFRRLEAEAVAELVARGPIVIALGGGALLDDRSRELLRERSVLVHLHVPWNDLRTRVTELVATRPLMQGRTLDEIHQLYLERERTYGAASVRVAVVRDGPALAAAEILEALTGRTV